METVLPRHQAVVMDEEVATLLRKGAITHCRNVPGFFSRVFLVSKKNGTFRPVINLRPLNQFLYTPSFSMTTIRDIFNLLQRGHWGICIDLQDAYFHIPVHRRHRRFLQFIWRGQAFQYQCLPFGLSTSPRTFVRVTKPVLHLLRTEGIQVVAYLDDFLVVAPSPTQAARDARRTVALLKDLGFSISWEKTNLSPSQEFTYLGLCWNTKDLTVSLPSDKRRHLRATAAVLQRSRHTTARKLMQFLGRANFAAYAIPLARLHYRELQRELRAVYKQPRDLKKVLVLSQEARAELQFWQQVEYSPRSLRPPQPEITMATDASKKGWGASLQSMTAAGRWPQEVRNQHINQLEMRAVWEALQVFKTHLQGKCVCVQIDNKTTVAYLAKEGGTRSNRLSRLARQVLLWCQEHTITLCPVHVRGMANTVADSLSRDKETEWHLNPAVAEEIFRRYGTPHIDLFASQRTAQLPRYMSLERSDKRAFAVDAFSQRWTFPLLYAFPPPTLVPTVLNKLQDSTSRMLLIAPCWSDAPWLPVLLKRAYDIPSRLPTTLGTIRNMATGYPVKDLETLRLVAWPLCGGQQEFPCQPEHSLPWKTAGGKEHVDNTCQSGESGRGGVLTSIWTQLPSLSTNSSPTSSTS